MKLTQEQLDEILGRKDYVQDAFAMNYPSIKSTPQDPILGTMADLMKPVADNRVGQFMGGRELYNALQSLSYDTPIMRGQNLQTSSFTPEYLAAAAGFLPLGKFKKIQK